DSQIIYNPETVAGKPVIESKEELTITPTIVTSMEVFDTATQESVNSEKDSVIIKTESEKPAVIIYDPQPKVTGTEPVSSINKDSEIIVLPKVVTSSAVNSDCKNFAKDADFLRVRKKMAAETNNDAMIQVAKKEFRIACFSTEQIRNLSY